MKTNKLICIVLAVLLFCSALSGCGKKAPAVSSEPFALVAAEPAELIRPDYGETDSAAETAAHGANDFAFRFSASLAEQAGEENLVCSPFSAWLPLAALVNATDKEYKPELMEALGAAGITEDDLNRAASRMLYFLTQTGEHHPLEIANALFVSNNETAKMDFAQTFADYYRGSVMQVDFSSLEAVDAINTWASDNTHGLIDNIVEDFSENTVSAIANAIYFSDRWESEFNESETTEDVFHAPNGDTTANYMLREGYDQTYYEDDTLQAMPLEFTSGAKLYIILPNDGDAAGLLKSLNSEHFNTICEGMSSRTGRLLLPRFSIESGVMSLRDALKTLGVPLFDPENEAITALIDSRDGLWISDAVQKAIITVDEKGTTAAAVTVMVEEAACEPEETEPFEMICDQPFVFVLTGRTYDGGDQVLFTGIVNEPTE